MEKYKNNFIILQKWNISTLKVLTITTACGNKKLTPTIQFSFTNIHNELACVCYTGCSKKIVPSYQKKLLIDGRYMYRMYH